MYKNVFNNVCSVEFMKILGTENDQISESIDANDYEGNSRESSPAADNSYSTSPGHV